MKIGEERKNKMKKEETLEKRGKGKKDKKENFLQKVWYFLWDSNSIWSWIIDIILMFLLVKFVIFPGMGLILATPLPFVIIESTSMEHEGSLDSWFSLHGAWYLENNITKADTEKWPWSSGLYKGDIIVVQGLKDYSYKEGDVIIFHIHQQTTPIIHRIIKIETLEQGTIYSTKGDHNDGQLPYELEIQEEQILGKAVVQIPKVGWVKLFFVELLR